MADPCSEAKIPSCQGLGTTKIIVTAAGLTSIQTRTLHRTGIRSRPHPVRGSCRSSLLCEWKPLPAVLWRTSPCASSRSRIGEMITMLYFFANLTSRQRKRKFVYITMNNQTKLKWKYGQWPSRQSGKKLTGQW